MANTEPRKTLVQPHGSSLGLHPKLTTLLTHMPDPGPDSILGGEAQHLPPLKPLCEGVIPFSDYEQRSKPSDDALKDLNINERGEATEILDEETLLE